MAPAHARFSYQKMDDDDPDAQHEAVELGPFNTVTSASFNYGAVPTITSDLPKGWTSTEKMPIRPASTATMFSGWRGGATSAAGLASISLCINLGVGIWLCTQGKNAGGLTEVYRGNCNTAKQLSIWVHLAINILSTLLLGGSNYCMQCVSAPTRKEIDKAHSQGKYLDIGVPSMRNLGVIGLQKNALWWILGLTSIPLHLMYNSAFYSSLSNNDYNILIVTPDFVTGGAFDLAAAIDASHTIWDYDATIDVDPAAIQSEIGTARFERLEVKQCIRDYAQVFLSSRRNLVLVSNADQANNSLLYLEKYETSRELGDGRYTPYNWSVDFYPSQIKTDTDRICRAVGTIYQSHNPPNNPTACDAYISEIEAASDEWEPWGYQVQYCMSETVDESCSFNGNIPIIFTVIACNVAKLLLMLIVAFRLRGSPLITIGDAIASFLQRPDLTTEGLCLLTRQDVTRGTEKVGPDGRPLPGRLRLWPPDASATKLQGQPATARRYRWSQAASWRRWVFTIALTAIALVVVAGLLAWASKRVVSRTRSISIWKMGFGAVNVNTLINGWDIEKIADPSTQILASILIANLPQTILSFLYLNLNGLLTSMFLADEWSDFARERKTLRVSTPQGRQRSNHFLQLPYRMGVPLMVLSGLLHWLVSQSIFLAIVSEYTPLGDLATPVAIATCGFSPVAMLTLILVGAATIAGVIGLSRLRYDGGIPLVGSCSVAIAAACHRPTWDVDAHLNPVQWGAVPGAERETGVGHCCFTSGDVEELHIGRMYAGIIPKLD
ncbi:uncharacterized protein Z518_00039 [Rhinocladiella mackenziei CBS 650.93]|uniref:DUF6536 domain-containing protein n=1 Tax=Rhinocladiella mackenziei CBS 650.93 TaxID=1442369 RepID=A0A0D2IZZ8_9EURO|nr:uncharacterized protein Z518_00039 [Rhinocladiella mackenziei CBS 650.93]KIX08961.1 hypothetical protein Z518_00039 [Rhinocladiella mackenziei CBS 650.93]